jgi:hypothetical protein
MEAHSGKGWPVWAAYEQKAGLKWVYGGQVDLSTISNWSTPHHR